MRSWIPADVVSICLTANILRGGHGGQRPSSGQLQPSDSFRMSASLDINSRTASFGLGDQLAAQKATFDKENGSGLGSQAAIQAVAHKRKYCCGATLFVASFCNLATRVLNTSTEYARGQMRGSSGR